MTCLERHGGRRFILAVGSLVISTIMLCFDKINGGEYVTLCLLTYGAYIGGNVAQKNIEAKNAKPPTE